jgi:hypothetical protein
MFFVFKLRLPARILIYCENSPWHWEIWPVVGGSPARLGTTSRLQTAFNCRHPLRPWNRTPAQTFASVLQKAPFLPVFIPFCRPSVVAAIARHKNSYPVFSI